MAMAMAEVVEREMAESRSSNRGAKAMVLEDEPQWVTRIRESLQVTGKEDDDVDIRVSVFDVPKQLQVHKPEAYSPQFIGLGPYHHRHPELYGMERYKIDAARRALKRLLSAAAGPNLDVLDELVNELKDHDRLVRAHYHRYLELSKEALSLMMIMDGAFLLEFLTIHHHHHAAEEEGEGASSNRMAHLVDLGGSGTGRKSAHGLILRDMLMLENQIPLFVLIMIKARCSSMSRHESSRRLTLMVRGLMNELCPFKMEGNFPETSCDVNKHAHLLELLYHLVVPTDTAENAHTTPPFSGQIEQVEIPVGEQHPDGGGQGQEEKPSAGTCSEQVNVMVKLFEFIAPKLKGGRLGKVIKPIEFVVKAPWNKLAGIPGMNVVENFMSADANQQEITIPSVSELVSSGVKFKPTHGNLSSESTIAFDRKTATLRLPAVTLDGNTEVVLRNLVAYESSAVSGPLVLTRYTELMNGIIDTDEDVALLRKRGVVLNHMKKKKDGEAAKLWNSMSRSVQHSKVPTLDKVIEKVNRYYDGRWSVKTKRFMRKYVLSSWKMLTFLATISMLLLTTVQAFCSVYACSRWWFGDMVAIVPSDSE